MHRLQTTATKVPRRHSRIPASTGEFCGTTAQPSTMEQKPKPPKASTLRSSGTRVLRQAQLLTYHLSAVESCGRLGEEDEFVDELPTHAAGGRDGDSIAKKGVFKERLLQSGHFRGYTGGHIEESSAVQAGTRTPRSGAENNSINIEHIDTNGLGMQCRCTERVTFSNAGVPAPQQAS